MSDLYLYKKIENDIKEQINSGSLKSGDKVPSVKDIRAQYKVSHITALRVLKELGNENYIQFIKGKGYFVNDVPDYQAEQERYYRIACITRPSREATLHDNYFNDINQAIQRTCMSKGFDTVYPICNLAMEEATITEDAQQNIKKTMLELIDKVDGFVIDERVVESVLQEFCAKNSKPAIMVGRLTDANIDSVIPDNCDGARQIAELSLKMGYQKFVICNNLFQKSVTEARTKSFYNTLIGNGIEPEQINTVGFNDVPYEETIKGINKVIDPNVKTVIFSPLDVFARYLTDYFVNKDIVLGKMLGVVGFYGMGYATLREPHVATVDVHPQKMGEKAAAVLISRINNELFEKPGNFTVPSTFIIGDTL